MPMKKKMFKVIFAISLPAAAAFVLTSLFAVCTAQEFAPYLADNFASGEYPAEIRMGVRTLNSGDGTWMYTDLTMPVYRYRDTILRGSREFVFYLNPKVTVTDFSTDEESLGLVIRYLYPDKIFEEGFIFGVNLFYDTHDSKNSYRYNQIGAGVEFLSRWVDLRFNSYLPITDKNLKAQSYEFGQNGIIQHSDYEEAMPGFDLEAGFLVPALSEFVETRIYGGGYWYDSDLGVEVEGSMVRLEVRPSPAMAFTVEARNDDVFGDKLFIGFVVIFEIGSPLQERDTFSAERWRDQWRFGRGTRSLAERMTDAIVRDPDIVIVEKRKSKGIQDMIYVNNSNAGAEDGSLDNPYNTLAEAIADPLYVDGTWIFVDEGDGTNTGYTGSFTLTDGTTIWGEGFEYLGLAGGGYPIIDGGSAPYAITLGDDNTVMGLTIRNAATAGIYGDDIAGGAQLTNNIIINNAGAAGIRIRSTGTDIVSAAISGNTITGGAEGIRLESNDTSRLSVTISGSTITQQMNAGIRMNSNDGSILSAIISGNTVTDSTGAGILLESGGVDGIISDLGGGALDSAGGNSIYNNTVDIDNDGTGDATPDGTVSAQNNWWGADLTPVVNEVDASAYTSVLEQDPN